MSTPATSSKPAADSTDWMEESLRAAFQPSAADARSPGSRTGSDGGIRVERPALLPDDSPGAGTRLPMLTLLQTGALLMALLAWGQTSGLPGDSIHQIAAGSQGLSDLAGPPSSGLLWVIWAQGILMFLACEACVRRQQSMEVRIAKQRVELSRTRGAMIVGMSHLSNLRDDGSAGHPQRVGRFAAIIAEAASRHPDFRGQITQEFVHLIEVSALLHDIGKIGIQDSILQKPGPLTPEERQHMQTHTHISSRCLQRVEECLGEAGFLNMAHEIALSHHEHWAGTGYPTGLRGDNIPLSARIVAIADVYDALSEVRVYKEAYPHQRCVDVIRAGSGTQFDPRLVDIFLTVADQFREIVARSEAAARRSQLVADYPTTDTAGSGTTGADPGSSTDETLDQIMREVESLLEITAGPAAPSRNSGTSNSRPSADPTPARTSPGSDTDTGTDAEADTVLVAADEDTVVIRNRTHA